jgi:hypothetical protein
MLRALPALLLVALPACPEEEIEGDDAEECRDGADNDQDGYFDCQDNGCWDSPDCAGDDDTGDDDSVVDDDSVTDDDSTGDDDTAGDDDPCGSGDEAAGLLGFTLTYSMAYDYNPEPIGITDCVMTYDGASTALVETRGRCARWEGSWSQTGTNCPPDLDQLVWTQASDTAVHSFVFGADLLTLDRWLADDVPEGWEPENADWAMWDMAAAMNGGYVVYVEVVPVPEVYLTVTHTVTVDFAGE